MTSVPEPNLPAVGRAGAGVPQRRHEEEEQHAFAPARLAARQLRAPILEGAWPRAVESLRRRLVHFISIFIRQTKK